MLDHLYTEYPDAFGRVLRFAESNLPLLIVGPTGAGKTELARELHDRSPRRNSIFHARGCGEFGEETFVSELFGNEKGAFTDAKESRPGVLRKCDGGTVVLEDIDALSLKNQKALLSWLDTGSVASLGGNVRIRVDVRFMATTNADLHQNIENNAFLLDLYFRIARATIMVPSLAARMGAVRAAIEGHAKAVAAQYPELAAQRGFSEEALSLLKSHDWPGNHREIEGVVTQVLFHVGPEARRPISISDLLAALGDPVSDGRLLNSLRNRARKDDEHVLKVLRITRWNIQRSAELLGFSRQGLYKKIKINGWSNYQ